MKGLYKGNCNRTACQQPGAIYFNHSTEKYYCAACAELINQANPEAYKMYGHEVCTVWRHIGAEPKDKQITGIVRVERIDGTKNFEERTTRDKAVEQLEAMKRVYPGYYTISGEHLLDGSIDLKFNAVKGILNSMTFKFIPDGLHQKTTVR